MRFLERTECALYGGAGAIFVTGDPAAAVGLFAIALAMTWIRASYA